MKSKIAVLLTLAAMVALVGAMAPAHATVYNSQAAFASAVPGIALETFESGVLPTGGALGCLSPISQGVDPSGCFGGGAGLATGPSYNDTAGFNELILVGTGVIGNTSQYLFSFPDDTFEITFAAPGVEAVGFNPVSYNGGLGADTCSIDAYSGATVVESTTSPCDPIGGDFVGITSATPITRVTVSSTGSGFFGTDYAGVDNLQFGTPTTLTANSVLPSLTESASLKSLIGGNALAGETVSFTDFFGTVTGTTNATGDADCCLATAVAGTTANGNSYSADFAGSAGGYPYGASSSTGTL